MKFKITTTYYNVDQKWLDWYLERLESAEHTPGSMSCAKVLRKSDYAEFSSKDPTSEVEATTQYEVVP